MGVNCLGQKEMEGASVTFSATPTCHGSGATRHCSRDNHMLCRKRTLIFSFCLKVLCGKGSRTRSFAAPGSPSSQRRIRNSRHFVSCSMRPGRATDKNSISLGQTGRKFWAVALVAYALRVQSASLEPLRHLIHATGKKSAVRRVTPHQLAARAERCRCPRETVAPGRHLNSYRRFRPEPRASFISSDVSEPRIGIPYEEN